MTTKIVETPGWDACARTIDSFSNNGAFQFRVGQDIGIVCGLNDQDRSAHYDEINYAFFIESGKYRIVEQGIVKTSSSSYAIDAVFRITRTSEVVRYFINDLLVYTSTIRSSGTVFGDCSLYAYLDTVIDAEIFDYSIEVSTTEWNFGDLSLELLLSSTDLVDGNFSNIDLDLTVDGTGVGQNKGNLDLNLDVFGSTAEDTSLAHIDLGFTLTGSELAEVRPDYNVANIDLDLSVYAVSRRPENNFGDIDLGFAAVGSDVASFANIDLDLSIEIFEGYKNLLVSEFNDWSVTITLWPPVYLAHETTYSYEAAGKHHTSYESESSQVFTVHENTWSFSTSAIQDTSWESVDASLTFIQNTHETSWLSLGGTSTIVAAHETSWLSSGSTSTVSIAHEVTWDSFVLIPGYAVHEVSWNSAGATSLVLSTHTASWASSGASSASASASHTTAWTSLPSINITHTTSYQSVVEDFAIHTHTWKSFVQQNVGIHEVVYRSYTLDPQFVLANAYIEPDIQLLSASVTADEDSPYYQCEVELRNAKDYQFFVRDQAFILHLFADEYHFVVDSKGLSRTIDDEGNYQESATISGLSPLCLQAAPRSTPITKTWVTPTYVSEIVEELIGPVTWNLVDWMLPGYRLAADKADPFELAQNIVTAAGGLLESQPDGSVVVRHRWPISIAELDSGTPTQILSETSIFSAQQQPTQDVLMNRIRIMDSNAGYQDRLEYEPYKLANGDDDPFGGLMYAYLSPWRDGLRIVTTRGSKIQIGLQTESVKYVYDLDAENTAETITFENGQSSVQYPIMTLGAFEWLDEDLGGLTFTPYATNLEASATGTYSGYSLAKIAYTSRRIQVPIRCTPTDTNPVEAQFLLLENQ